MSLVVLMEIVDTFVPAELPMYGTESCKLKKLRLSPYIQLVRSARNQKQNLPQRHVVEWALITSFPGEAWGEGTYYLHQWKKPEQYSQLQLHFQLHSGLLHSDLKWKPKCPHWLILEVMDVRLESSYTPFSKRIPHLVCVSLLTHHICVGHKEDFLHTISKEFKRI